MDESLEKLLADLVATSSDTSSFDDALSYFPEFKNVDSKLLADFVATAQDVGDINQAISYFPEFGGDKNITNTEPEKELVAETVPEPEEVDSSKISKAKEFDKGIFKMAEREAQAKYKETGEVDLDLMPEEEEKKVGFFEDKLATLTKGVSNTVKTFGEFGIATTLNAVDLFLFSMLPFSTPSDARLQRSARVFPEETTMLYRDTMRSRVVDAEI